VDVKLYIQRGCRFCAAAKRLLEARCVQFAEVDVTDDQAARERLVRLGGMATLPQLFVGDRPVGGFDAMQALDRSGRLTQALEADGRPQGG
jgi:glutaredoxin 3